MYLTVRPGSGENDWFRPVWARNPTRASPRRHQLPFVCWRSLTTLVGQRQEEGAVSVYITARHMVGGTHTSTSLVSGGRTSTTATPARAPARRWSIGSRTRAGRRTSRTEAARLMSAWWRRPRRTCARMRTGSGRTTCWRCRRSRRRTGTVRGERAPLWRSPLQAGAPDMLPAWLPSSLASQRSPWASS